MIIHECIEIFDKNINKINPINNKSKCLFAQHFFDT